MITEKVRIKMYDAMKQKDKENKEFYAFLLDKLMKAAKAKQTATNPNPVLDESEEIAVIQSIVKQNRVAISEVQAKLPNMSNEKSVQEAKDFIAAREAELAKYEEFLPKQMTEEEINAAIQEAVNEIPEGTPMNKGTLMRYLMPRVKGKSDGKLVASLADAYLRNC